MQDINEIVLTAIEHLPQADTFKIKWHKTNAGKYDGTIEITLNGKKESFYAAIKKELRTHHIHELMALGNQYAPLMIIAHKISPSVKHELRVGNIAYLESAGNLFLKTKYNFIWIDGRRGLPMTTEKPNRAFTKTGLKVLFHFLIQEDLINAPYRTIAETTGTALGNVNCIISGLKDQGFIKNIDNKKMMLVNKPALLDRWITGFTDRLKPTLYMGSFRFMKPEAENNWEAIQFSNNVTQWGSEPAAAMITKYLHPAIFTIYTGEPKNDLTKKYLFVPDINGNIHIFKRFWNMNILTDTDNRCVHPILIYADLMMTGDPRNMETAQKIYTRYVQPLLK